MAKKKAAKKKAAPKRAAPDKLAQARSSLPAPTQSVSAPPATLEGSAIGPAGQTNEIIFGTNNPGEIVKRCAAIADALVPIIDEKKLYQRIPPSDPNGKKYVYVEGWVSMISMLGVFPSVDSVEVELRPFVRQTDGEHSKEKIATAWVSLRTMSGTIITRANASVSSFERNWRGRDEYAMKSMAQTRATGKACRLAFSWIMSMAGFAGTPAEDMTGGAAPAPAQQRAPVDDLEPDGRTTGVLSPDEKNAWWDKCQATGIHLDTVKEIVEDVRGVPGTAGITADEADNVLLRLNDLAGVGA